MDKKPSLLILKSFYCPDDSFVSSNKNGIISAIDLSKKLSVHNIKNYILFIGFSQSCSFYSFLDQIVYDLVNEINIKCIKLDINYGKLHILKIFDLHVDKHIDFVLYSDHDIIFDYDDNSNMIIDAIKNIINTNILFVDNNKIISFDQAPDCRHNPVIRYNIKTYVLDQHYLFYSNKNNKNIATACMIFHFTFIHEFKKLYSDNIYGDEDLLIGNMLNDNKYKHLVIDIKVRHDFDINYEYSMMKRKLILDIVLNKLIN
jgi:hypothetical protein